MINLITTDMKTGTKSLLFGVHAIYIHPFYVAAAWIILYGFPFDPRIWLSFFFHDLGYWGKDKMDDEDGQKHVELGGRIMGVFGKEWREFTMLHSRFYAEKHDLPFSKLCVADKFSICLESYGFYMLRASLSGEITEYMDNWESGSKMEWFFDIKLYMLQWTNSIEGQRARIDRSNTV